MSSVPFVGWYFRKFHAWYSKKFPKHQEHCHATGIETNCDSDSEPTDPDIRVQIPFPTTDAEQLNVPTFIKAMRDDIRDPGPYGATFIASVENLAYTDQGMYNLLEKWYNCSDADEREELANDLLEGVRDYSVMTLTNPNVPVPECFDPYHVEELKPLVMPKSDKDEDDCCHGGCCDDDH